MQFLNPQIANYNKLCSWKFKKNIIKIYIYDLEWIIDKLYREILIEIRCGIHKYIHYMKDKIRNCFDKF